MLLELVMILLLSAPLRPEKTPVEKCSVFSELTGAIWNFGTDCVNLSISSREGWLVISDREHMFLMPIPLHPPSGKFSWYWGDTLAQFGGEWIDVSEVNRKQL